MLISAVGLVAMFLAGLAAHVFRRREDLVRLHAQTVKARLSFDGLLRQRREMAQVWCALCEEREILLDPIRDVRRKLARLASPVADLPVASKDEPSEVAFRLRLAEEERLGELIRAAYARFLETMGDEGLPRDFFWQYFQSLTRLEREIGEARELLNDCANLYNGRLRGFPGRLFRRWEGLTPRPEWSPEDAGGRSPRRAAPVRQAGSAPGDDGAPEQGLATDLSRS